MKNTTVVEVLNESKDDLNLYDFWYLIDDDEINEFIEKNEDEVARVVSHVIPEVMERLKLRMAFASAGEDK